MENTTGKKDMIINIAFGYFLNIGYEATTVRMICKEANIEPPTLYYYFGSKKGLFFAVVDKMLNDYQEVGDKKIEESNMHPQDILEAIYEKSVNYAMTHKKETKFYLRYTLFTPLELKKDIEDFTFVLKNNLKPQDFSWKESLTPLFKYYRTLYVYTMHKKHYDFSVKISDTYSWRKTGTKPDYY